MAGIGRYILPHLPVERLNGASAALIHVTALFELLVQHVADGINKLIDQLSDELDVIDDRVSEGVTKQERQKLGRVRRISVKVHRQLAGLRSLFHRLQRSSDQVSQPRLQIAPE